MKITAIVIAVLVVIVLILSVATVPTGYTGIQTMGGRVLDTTLEAGFHLKNPIAKIIKMDNREQKSAFNTQSFSADIQQVDIVGSINYNINKSTAMTLFKEVGTNYFATLITPRLLENTKAVFSKHSADALVSERESLSIQIRELLKAEMSPYGINIISVSIEDIDFTDAFTDAVEAKQVAEQTKLRIETEEAQRVSVSRSEAERRIIAANAEAEEKQLMAEANLAVARLEADAEAYSIQMKAAAEAEANERIAKSLTKELIEYVKATAWNGQNPSTVLSGNAVPVVTMD